MKLSLDTMSERERRMVQIGGVIAVVMLIFGVILPLDSSASKAKARIAQKQADLVWMRGVAPVLAANQQPAQGSTNGESLIVVVERSAVQMQKASFDAMIAWLSRLSQQNGIGVDGATIDTVGAPGLVNAAVVLHAQ
jgi:type II secretory pathway component PulM